MHCRKGASGSWHYFVLHCLLSSLFQYNKNYRQNCISAYMSVFRDGFASIFFLCSYVSIRTVFISVLLSVCAKKVNVCASASVPLPYVFWTQRLNENISMRLAVFIVVVQSSASQNICYSVSHCKTLLYMAHEISLTREKSLRKDECFNLFKELTSTTTANPYSIRVEIHVHQK